MNDKPFQSYPGIVNAGMCDDPPREPLPSKERSELETEWFRVEVSDRDGQVVAIETGMLAGRDIGEKEDVAIRKAIRHLQGFIGAPPDETNERVPLRYGKAFPGPHRGISRGGSYCTDNDCRCHGYTYPSEKANDPLAQLEDDATFGAIVEEIQAQRGEDTQS